MATAFRIDATAVCDGWAQSRPRLGEQTRFCNELWQVVALHHSASPTPALPESAEMCGNEGIPIKAILPLIRDFLPAIE